MFLALGFLGTARPAVNVLGLGCAVNVPNRIPAASDQACNPENASGRVKAGSDLFERLDYFFRHAPLVNQSLNFLECPTLLTKNHIKQGERPVVTPQTVASVARRGPEIGQSGRLPPNVGVIPESLAVYNRARILTIYRELGKPLDNSAYNDAAIGATALDREIPLITTDKTLAAAVRKLQGEARHVQQ